MSMAMHLAAHDSNNLLELIRLERRAFAAKIRVARAVLGWSQSEFGLHVGLTQRAVHKLEQGETEPRRATVRAIEEVWREQAIEFEDIADGGFRVTVRAPVLDRPASVATRRRAARLKSGVTSLVRRVS